MSQTTRFLLLLIGVSLLGGSCKVDSIGDPIIVPLIDQEFVLDLWENLQATTTSPLEIKMATITNENCLNAGILSTYERNNRNLKLTLFEILDPEVCDPGQAPAVGQEAIYDVNSGIYQLDVELQGVVVNPGTLTITSSSYKVEMQEENGTRWLHYELYRVPNAALWGYVTYSNAFQEQQCTDFINDIAAVSDPIQLPDGYYGHFTVADGGELTVNKMPNQPGIRPFIYSYWGPKATIDNLVADFEATATTGMELVLLDQQGNEW
ncbi:MAG: hypothetical protein DA408_20850 [Bacteroidetes bacterium]|nr:MAG: hypothetical protein C7N36_16110 [Bacteroidota bacterium]PTM08280.1 MAG: hypothetical protein DA408_20850 [Bacteroidota bacterium]